MKKIVAVLLALCMVFAISACGQPKEETPEANQAQDTPVAPVEENPLCWGLTPFEERQTLRIGFFTGSPLSYPFLWADNLGVFDALNIDIELICFTGGPAMMEANAEWDMASCGLGGLANGMKGYENLTIVDITDYEENLGLFARKDSPIANDPTNPEAWKGAECVFATGTTIQAVLANYLQTMDLTLADVVSTNMDNANALTGFNGGTGDVLGCWNAIALAAEDAGFVRITDAGQLGIKMPCGTFAQNELLENNMNLAATAVAVFHLAAEWVYASDENAAQAAEWYYDHCEEEGFLCTEDVAERTIDWYCCPTVDEYIKIFTETSPDDAGLYTSRDLLQAEKDILVGIDFFISEGKYTPQDRIDFLDNNRISGEVALAVKDLLGR